MKDQAQRRTSDFTNLLLKLDEQAVHISARQQMWTTIIDRLKSCPWIGKPGNLLQYMADGHFAFLAMWCRRVVDEDKKAVSLVGLLRRVELSEIVITRVQYETLMLNGQTDEHLVAMIKRIALRNFDAWAGSGADKYPSANAQADIQSLKHATDDIVHWVDRRLAHLDKRGADQTLSIKQTELAMNLIFELLKNTSQCSRRSTTARKLYSRLVGLTL